MTNLRLASEDPDLEATSIREVPLVLLRMLGNDLQRLVSYARALHKPGRGVDARTRRWARSLRTRGYVEIPNYLPKAQCEEWANQILALIPAPPELLGRLPAERSPYTMSLASRTVTLSEGAVVEFRRAETPEADDSGIKCVYHIERLVPGLGELRRDKQIAEIIHAASGQRLPSRAFKAFVHDSVKHTQGFHVDNDGAPCYKAFFALSDIAEPSDGAHAYVKRSMPPSAIKYLNVLRNSLHAEYLRSMNYVPPRRVHTIQCTIGSVFIIDASGIHRALPQGDGHRRIVLVNGFDRWRYVDDVEPPVSVI